jgi:predicted RNA-binding protein (virulence factor B family)
MVEDSLKIGLYNTLKIARESEHGFYLKAQNEDEVLLPNIYITPSMNRGDELKVFLYTDSEDRLVATTQKPKVILGEFAYLEVVAKSKIGLFLDWGLPKDLFVPLREQKGLGIGQKALFYVGLDRLTNRLYASQKIEKFLKQNPRFKTNQKVQITIFAKTPLGYKALIENSYTGMIYDNEIFEKLTLGEKRDAYIKQVREDDKIDLILQPIGKDSLKIACEKILSILKEQDKIALNYKSDPDLINEKLGISKKLFKKALTTLIDEGKIEVGDSIKAR